LTLREAHVTLDAISVPDQRLLVLSNACSGSVKKSVIATNIAQSKIWIRDDHGPRKFQQLKREIKRTNDSPT
jgi:hypothetical protein